MVYIFVVKDRTGRKIHLTNERWKHIVKEHPDISDFRELEMTIEYPTSIRPSDRDPENVRWFYRFIKKEKLYLLVSVKYLNGDGFVITAHYTNKII